jgi:hypothetical protein
MNPKLKLTVSILTSLGILALCLWLLLGSDLQSIKDEYRLIVGDKAKVTGRIIKAEEFQDYAKELERGITREVSGYLYTFAFQPRGHDVIEVDGWNYGELPLDKGLGDIPYEVQVEYLVDDPALCRIIGLWSNHLSVGEWFKHHILFKLLGLLFCIYICYRLVQSGIVQYRLENERGHN